MGFPGYVRLHDDKAGYTGVYRNGGPSTKDNHSVQLSSLMDRSRGDVRGVNVGMMSLQYQPSAVPSFMASGRASSSRNLLRTSSGRELPSGAYGLDRSGSGRDLLRSESGKNLVTLSQTSGQWLRSALDNSADSADSANKDVRGPARFFYDKSTYTGVHKNGGPSTKDYNRVELSDLMNRAPADVRGVNVGSVSRSTANPPIASLIATRTPSGRNAMKLDPIGKDGSAAGTFHSYTSRDKYTSGREPLGPRTASGKSLVPNRKPTWQFNDPEAPGQLHGYFGAGKAADQGRDPFGTSFAEDPRRGDFSRPEPPRGEVIRSDNWEPLRSPEMAPAALGGAQYGPERFFYDTSTYTGVHKNGGPSTVDQHRVELSDLMDRSPADARGVKINAFSARNRAIALS